MKPSLDLIRSALAEVNDLAHCMQRVLEFFDARPALLVAAAPLAILPAPVPEPELEEEKPKRGRGRNGRIVRPRAVKPKLGRQRKAKAPKVQKTPQIRSGGLAGRLWAAIESQSGPFTLDELDVDGKRASMSTQLNMWVRAGRLVKVREGNSGVRAQFALVRDAAPGPVKAAPSPAPAPVAAAPVQRGLAHQISAVREILASKPAAEWFTVPDLVRLLQAHAPHLVDTESKRSDLRVRLIDMTGNNELIRQGIGAGAHYRRGPGLVSPAASPREKSTIRVPRDPDVDVSSD